MGRGTGAAVAAGGANLVAPNRAGRRRWFTPSPGRSSIGRERYLSPDRTPMGRYHLHGVSRAAEVAKRVQGEEVP